MDVTGVRHDFGGTVYHGECLSCWADRKAARKGIEKMPIIFAVLGTPLAHFAEGAILGATVYLVSRGKRNQLKNKK